jgi:hypothetical protein
MTAFQYRMPAGIPGELNRIFACVVETQVITPSGAGFNNPTAYGVPLVIDATTGNVGNMRAMIAADYTANSTVNLLPYGILCRPFPTGNSQDPLGTSTPPASGACDVLKTGYINVLLSGSAAAIKGSPAYIWLAAASGTHIVGGWEAANTGGSTMLVAGAYFMGAADANGMVEISFNL